MKGNLLFRLVKGLVGCIYPKMTLEGTQFLPDGPAVIVANHAQIL